MPGTRRRGEIRIHSIHRYAQVIRTQVLPGLGEDLRVKHFTPDEVARFLNQLEDSGRSPDLARAVLTGMANLAVRMRILDILATALRPQEVLGAQWEQVDLDAEGGPVITVSGTLLEPRPENGYRLVRHPQPKSKKGWRTILLRDEAVEILHARRKRTKYRRLRDPIFASQTGGFLQPRDMRRRLETAIYESGLCEFADVDFRALRATVTTRVTGGLDLPSAQHALGHSSPTTTSAFYVATPLVAPDFRSVLDDLFAV